MEYCTNWQNNTMGNCNACALSAEEWQSALFNLCTALLESKWKQCLHSIFLDRNAVLHCTSVKKRQSFIVSLLQHFYDYKESRLASRNIGLRDLYIVPNAANIAVVLHLKDLFVIHIHVISACCDLDRRARASGKSSSKSSPHTCMDIPFSFLLIFPERPLLRPQKRSLNKTTYCSNKNKAEMNWIYCTQTPCKTLSQKATLFDCLAIYKAQFIHSVPGVSGNHC